jgi:hypothetical protein
MLPATLFMEYQRTGNRSHYERLHFQRRRVLGALILAECIEGRGRFLDDIINGIWCICEESFWGVPAHSSAQRFPASPLPDPDERIIDLFAGETAALLALAHFLLRSRLDPIAPVVCERIRREVKDRILDPYLERTDFWWMGLESSSRPGAPNRVNNWNPWCNSNCLAAFLLIEEDSSRRLAGVEKALRSLDRFIDPYPADGGCDEGTSYWSRAGGSLFDCLELLYGASDGQINVYGEPLIANIGRYLYRAYIGGGDYLINFADGGARTGIAADLVYRYGLRTGDPSLIALGSAAYHRQKEAGSARMPDSLLRALPALFDEPELEAATDRPPYVRDAWLEDIQVMAAREQEGSDRGLYLAAKGGHNGESHNHNDVGQFIVYLEGRPVIVDVGVETYTAKTFSAQRYDIWTMQSAYHNLPTINGIQQAVGDEFAADEVAYHSDDSGATLSMNLANAYPEAAGVEEWNRTVSLDRSASPSVVLQEKFRLAQPSEVTLTLMTAPEPQLDDSGVIRLVGEQITRIRYPGDELDATVERIPLADDRLRAVWGDALYRVRLTSRVPVAEADWTISITTGVS